MLSSNSNTSKTRSLRVPPAGTLKLPSTTTSQPASGPSNVALFLTNLRLLDLDLREDWPDITAKTFSTKDVQQNQKKRIQCVEWAFYQLFVLWDPEEAQNKLQPFFPPLEPLQSLNLRAALFRCLDQAKKNGVLGRDTVLRKTMLDECKGERLEEVLAVFSNAVLKSVVLNRESPESEAIAQQLAFENFSYSGERTVLSALILAHKVSLEKHLKEKEDSRARYQDFSDLLELNERRVTRRHEQLKEVLDERGASIDISPRDVRSLQNQAQKNWSGNEEWLGTVLYGDSKVGEDGLLATRFDKVWKHAERGAIGEVESKGRVGLLEQLDARVKNQENRLARWQDFSKTLSKHASTSSPENAKSSSEGQGKIDLGFNLHQKIQISRENSGQLIEANSESLGEYNRMIENMKSEIADVRKPRGRSHRPRESLLVQKRRSLLTPPQPEEDSRADDDEGWSSASETEEPSPGFASHASKSLSQTPPSEAPVFSRKAEEIVPDAVFDEESVAETTLVADDIDREGGRERLREPPEIFMKPAPPNKMRSPSPLPPKTPPRQQSPPPKPRDTESDLADQILNSMSAASPSPKKPRHTLSLAERTRLSMSRASHSQLSDLHDNFDLEELPQLPINKPRPSLALSAPSEPEGLHEGLIERTRKSMAGFEAAQKKAQLDRRRSIKDAKKKQRESSYFPKVEEEVTTLDVSAIELIEGDPDYESVFKSRPKIKTSPAVSPTRNWNGESAGEDL
ncbi:hypothetical protein G7Y89_g14578 [Cudoniella acicularis]|uniref:HAUS augmin-like complex subunit 6 N-terminal domain-containing protein n=1 Tax=Cudoniella acicularis TaxID=354080 RepID=A0A8H4R0Y8_9HELO|nr:hypothetical protein G7Y89_g14578 [Cudoniella acicularis]